MRNALLVGVLLIPVAAFARTSVRVGGGTKRTGRGRFTSRGHSMHGGVRLKYSRSTPHSKFTATFGGGTQVRRGGRPTWHGTGHWGSWSYRGYRGYPGVQVYRGWHPYSPCWYSRHAPYSEWRAVGPFSYTDAIVFGGVGGGTVFGYQQRVGEAARARAAGPPGTAVRGDYAALPAQRIIDRGDDLFVRGQFAEAVVAYRAAAAKAPTDPLASLALGHGLFATGQYTPAARALRRALQLHPELVGVRMSRRQFYGDPAAFNRQLARLERHVAQVPGDHAARFVLGYNFFFTQQHAKAARHFAVLGDADREAALFVHKMTPRK